MLANESGRNLSLAKRKIYCMSDEHDEHRMGEWVDFESSESEGAEKRMVVYIGGDDAPKYDTHTHIPIQIHTIYIYTMVCEAKTGYEHIYAISHRIVDVDGVALAMLAHRLLFPRSIDAGFIFIFVLFGSEYVSARVLRRKYYKPLYCHAAQQQQPTEWARREGDP